MLNKKTSNICQFYFLICEIVSYDWKLYGNAVAFSEKVKLVPAMPDKQALIQSRSVIIYFKQKFNPYLENRFTTHLGNGDHPLNHLYGR